MYFSLTYVCYWYIWRKHRFVFEESPLYSPSQEQPSLSDKAGRRLDAMLKNAARGSYCCTYRGGHLSTQGPMNYCTYPGFADPPSTGSLKAMVPAYGMVFLSVLRDPTRAGEPNELPFTLQYCINLLKPREGGSTRVSSSRQKRGVPDPVATFAAI